ncbi:4Fe-4S dicluster domain-containing protein [Raoultibacter massiliensis]|uniref:4Fe-4S dicluster domain-containing protein n=1 Tax=Raoultibacter massiliensis TaxID=1852371 RepID=A0ABV1JCK8_9ACTN|nr:4Fe-4S dicluster domain-containing protein [Raoultibacter massiliensis]
MSQYAFYFDGTRCTGCKTCEMSCKDFNDLSTGITFRKVLEATLGETVRDESGVITTTCISYPVSLSCNHCDSPICMAKCPQGAISKDPDTGFVSNDLEKCIGCGTCALVCPYGAPKIDEEAKKAVRCHGCADRVAEGTKPVCVEACPARALDFGVVEEMEKLGERANIAPLPDVSETTPNLFIKGSADAQPVGSAEVANPLEVA